jgi:hypothetical protein
VKALFLLAFLLAQLAGPESFAPRPVTVELKNGSRIDGTLIEKDGAFAVLKVAGGEVRIPVRSVLRLVEHDAAGKPAEKPLPVAPGRVRIDLGPPGAISFEVPDAWTETKIEGRERGFTDPTQSLFFGVSGVADAHSLWNLTAGIKKEYVKLYPGFALERERFGVLGTVRSWEIEFRYEKEGQPFREIQLLLDFGDTKRILTFTTAAPRFDELVARFRGVIESLRTGEGSKGSDAAPDGGSPAVEKGSPSPPGNAPEAPWKEGRPGRPSPADPGEGAVEEPRIDIERLLPPHLRSDP